MDKLMESVAGLNMHKKDLSDEIIYHLFKTTRFQLILPVWNQKPPDSKVVIEW